MVCRCLELHVAEPSLSVAMSIVHDMEFSRDIQIRVEMKLLAAGYIELCQTTKLDHDLEKGDVKPNPDLDTELKGDGDGGQLSDTCLPPSLSPVVRRVFTELDVQCCFCLICVSVALLQSIPPVKLHPSPSSMNCKRLSFPRHHGLFGSAQLLPVR